MYPYNKYLIQSYLLLVILQLDESIINVSTPRDKSITKLNTLI